jgi:glycosyltransferase involved in cell wall biosynthesis
MIMTFKWEMQPLFLLEDMSANKPWVSTNVGSVGELEVGIISTTLAKALASSLFKILQDSSLKNRLGKQGATQWAAEFSTAIVYKRWHELILAAIKS